MAKSKEKSKRRNSIDAVYSELANKVLLDSLRMKQGETLTVETWNSGFDFAKHVVKAARKAGVFPILLVEDEETYINGLRNTPKEVLGKMGRHEHGLISSSDGYVFIPGPPIGVYSPMITREESSSGTAYNSSWYEAAEKAKLRGARLTFGYVGKDLAKLLKKKEKDIVLHQLNASLVNFAALRASGEKIAQSVKNGSRATISASGTELSFGLDGYYQIEDGVVDEQDISRGENMTYLAPGMIQIGVDPSSASGRVKVSDSVTKEGLISDATLKFENGRIVSWDGSSKKRVAQLLEELPDASRALKILTVGFNPRMKYGFAQDRFVAGSIGLSGFGFTGIVKGASLEIDGKKLLEKGKILTN